VGRGSSARRWELVVIGRGNCPEQDLPTRRALGGGQGVGEGEWGDMLAGMGGRTQEGSQCWFVISRSLLNAGAF